jgi:hypothetical protein
MWPKTFDQRLNDWYNLRNIAKTQPIEQALSTVADWWNLAPWQPYYLHWDDHATWPDPWQLLNDNVYCDLAKALGILYTITLLDRADMAPADLILTEDERNLVQVGKTKYILNWNADMVVNRNLQFKIQRQYRHQQIL